MFPTFMHGAVVYVNSLWKVDRNCHLTIYASIFNGLSQGIFLVVFNLYILSLGIGVEVLGAILSAGPLAQAIGSIPMGFLAEKIGFRKVFLIIYGVSGLAKILQVSSGSVPLISAMALIGGLALAGDFVVRISFLAVCSERSQRTRVYSLSSMAWGLSFSLGALVGGFLPGIIQPLLGLDLVLAYRLTLYTAGLSALLAIIPNLFIIEPHPLEARKISLSPYLWGIDRFTVHQALISLFVGISIGMLIPFMNIYFIFHLGSTREFFGTVSALAVIPGILATSLSPVLASLAGSITTITSLRLLVPLFVVAFALTTNQYLGAIAYWAQNSLFQMSQPLSFAFAMEAASRKAKSAASAWLNVTFWLGNGLAAPVVGLFLARSNYRAPLLLASIAVILAGVLNQIFFRPVEQSLVKREQISSGKEMEAS